MCTNDADNDADGDADALSDEDDEGEVRMVCIGEAATTVSWLLGDADKNTTWYSYTEPGWMVSDWKRSIFDADENDENDGDDAEDDVDELVRGWGES